jgi:hypothetical protein
MLSERVGREAVQVVESTIPADMTIDEWRRRRPRTEPRRPRRRRHRTPDAARHLSLVPSTPSDPEPLAA